MPLVLQAATSGQATINPTDATTVTLTLPATTGTLAVSGGSPSFATLTVTGDALIDGLTVGQGGGNQGQATAFGVSALSATNTGGNNTAIGWNAMPANTSGANNTSLGAVSLYTNTTGSSNAGIGEESLRSNTTGSSNSALGFQSLYSNTTASNNTAVGYQAGYSQSGSAPLITAFGYQTLYSNTTGTNDGFGYQALKFNTTGDSNTALGFQVLQYNTTGSGNIGAGIRSLQTATTGSYNTAYGAYALYQVTTASSNTAVGYQAGYAITTGSENTLLGITSGDSITTGGNNVCLGKKAGSYTNLLTTGSRNICVGDFSNTSGSSATDQIVIGYNISGKGNSTGFINAGNGGVYQGNNSAAWSVASDQRLKKNIVNNNDGLDIISQIQVRNFEYRLPEEVTDLPQDQAIEITGVQLGVIAQELQQVCPDCVTEQTTGVLSVDSDEIFWHMLNAVKELKATVDAQAARIASLEGAK